MIGLSRKAERTIAPSHEGSSLNRDMTGTLSGATAAGARPKVEPRNNLQLSLKRSPNEAQAPSKPAVSSAARQLLTKPPCGGAITRATERPVLLSKRSIRRRLCAAKRK